MRNNKPFNGKRFLNGLDFQKPRRACAINGEQVNPLFLLQRI